MIELKDLGMRFPGGTVALYPTSLKIQKGQFTVLVIKVFFFISIFSSDLLIGFSYSPNSFTIRIMELFYQ
jgi:hypothetical protein